MRYLNENWTAMLLSNKDQLEYLINWVKLTDSLDISREDSYDMLTDQDEWNTTKGV